MRLGWQPGHRTRIVALRRVAAAAVTAAVAGTVLAGCADTPDQAGRDGRCVANFEAGTDYFADKVVPTEAANFSVEYHDAYAVLTVNPQSERAQRFVLHRCGTPEPELRGDLDGAAPIELPVRDVFLGAPSQIAFFTETGQLGAVAGVSEGALLVDHAAREAFLDGTIAQIGSGGDLDVPQIVNAHPGVLISDGTGNDSTGSDELAEIREAGIAVIPGADALEDSPLGRAEWIKVAGLLTGAEGRANEVYERVSGHYSALTESVGEVNNVTVLAGTNLRGAWSIPTGSSLDGRLLRAAGAVTPWDRGAGSATHPDTAEVVRKAGGAAVWLTVDNGLRTIAQLTAAEPALGRLTSVKTGAVWNGNKSLSPSGGNALYELGVARPDLVLGDLVAIVRPDLAPGHEYVFYRRLGS